MSAMFDNKCLKVEIVRTGNLELNQYVIHPHIRFHIVNFENGQYIRKDQVRLVNTEVENGAYHFENITELNKEGIPVVRLLIFSNLLREASATIFHRSPQTHVI